MRLTAKFIFVLVIGVILVSGTSAWVRVHQETRLFEAGIARYGQVFGQALADAIARTWKMEGEQMAIASLEKITDSIPELDLRWVWIDGKKNRELSAAEAERIRNGQEVMTHSLDRDGIVYSYFPVGTSADRTGAIRMSAAQQTHREVVHTILKISLVAMLAMFLVIATVAAVIGFFFVGRPARALVQKANRVAGGDLSGPLVLNQRDELGVIAQAMNSMCDSLAAERDKVAAESTARIAALEQLRHADRLTTVGKLASGIAHELGTPLNVIIGRATLAARGELHGEEALDNAQVVVAEAKRMAQIIRQLLDFSRASRSQKRDADLVNLVTQTLKLLEPAAQKKQVSFKFESDWQSTWVLLDEAQIQQALTNLIVNAIHATAQDGLVTTRLANVSGEFAGICLSVVDTGHGMDEATMGRVFEPFFTTKDVGEGTGLGLSVAYGIVKEHGGVIDVSSSVGAGSTFSIYLPRQSGGATTEAAA